MQLKTKNEKMQWMKKLMQLKKNQTSELVSLPKGKYVVGVKWVYKTKWNSNGDVQNIRQG